MELINCSETQKDSITTFDTLCTSPSIQRLKILIPLISPSMQGIFAFYIKMMELQYTMQLFKEGRKILFPAAEKNIQRTIDELDPYLSLQERSRVNSMKNMYQSFQQMKDMMEMVNAMKELFPDGFDMNNMGDMAGMMGGMGDMSDMFNMMNEFGGMTGNGTDT